MTQKGSPGEKRFATRLDLLLIVICLAIGGIWLFFQRHNTRTGNQVIVYSDNEIILTAPLREDLVYTVSNEMGTNTIHIENGQVYVTDADCPDKRCEQQGIISQPGETIICLPHRLIVEVSDEQ